MDSQKLKDKSPKEAPASESNGNGKYILVADDNHGDRLLLKMALEESKVKEEFRFVRNGLELLEFLEQCKPTRVYPGGPYPCLILLDLYMPRVNGHEALRVIRNDRELRKIPVIILSTSHSHQDVLQSYTDGANSFLSKPVEYTSLVKLIELVKKYWLEECHLPA
ncbi:MAG TPA: response regulator [bacterium]|nr:response regulator [bacterium]